MKIKKECYLDKFNIEYVDWRDLDLIKKFLNPSGRILPRKRTNCTAHQQKMVEKAIKRARFMGLIPYINY